MAKRKKTVKELLQAKGKEFHAFHITTQFKNPAPTGDAWGAHKMLITKIKECPGFFMYFCTWDRDPSHFSHITYGNINSTKFKGHSISERVGTSVDFSTDMSMPPDEWGDDVPDDVRGFLRNTIQDFISGMKAHNSSWGLSSSSQKMGFPLSSVQKYMETVTGVCMSRTKRAQTPRKIEPIVMDIMPEEENLTED